jgi:hypothetical protein
MQVVKLTQPVDAYGETLHELTFREPTGKDIRKTGIPQKSSEEDGVTYTHTDMDVVGKLIVVLGNVPPGTVDKLCLSDFLACSRAINRFFGLAVVTETSSEDSTTSPGDGSATPSRS